MKLVVSPGLLSVIKYPPSTHIPDIVLQALNSPSSDFVVATRTRDELSIVLPSELVQYLTFHREADTTEIKFEEEGGFRSMKISGVLDFSLIGIIYSLSKVLAEANIGIFVVSTFNTDYILVKGSNLDKAVTVLQQNGHEVITET